MRQSSRDEFVTLKNRNLKTVTVYEKVKTEVDTATGEIISQSTESVKKLSKEPDFIKVYYETMLAFNQIHDVPTSFVLSLSKFLEWSNDGRPMCVTINKRVKDILQEDCGVKIAQISRYISTSVENGLLFRTKYRGVYEVNPFMIAKGKWDSIRDLQCKFNFVNGKWIREVEEKNIDPEDENKDKVSAFYYCAEAPNDKPMPFITPLKYFILLYVVFVSFAHSPTLSFNPSAP